MLTVTSIEKGIVIDHISQGNGLKIFEKLKLDNVDFPVVLLMNVSSKKLGKKDMIKIQDNINLDLRVLGLIDPNVTINIIENNISLSKEKITIPKEVQGLFSCKNPRCISNHDFCAIPKFTLLNEKKLKYQCNYCEEITSYHI